MARGSDDDFNAWLAARGHVLPAGAPTAAVLRQRATDYLDSNYVARLVGDLTVAPILTALESATYAAAWYEAGNPGALSAAASQSGAVKRRKVDVIEIEYFDGSGDALADGTIRLSLVEGILSPYFASPQLAVLVI